MTKKTDAWMPLYIADYLADTSRLTTEQHGAYLLILMDYWRNGPPPDDEAVLCSITRLPLAQWRKARGAIRIFFTVADGKWTQKRADIERQDASQISSKRSVAGKEGASKRWGKQGGNDVASVMANAMANASQPPSQINAPSPTPSPSESTKPAVSVRTRGSRLSEAWEPGESGGAFAEQQGLRNGRAAAELAKFRDYWCSQPGQRGVKTDWQATWRNWVRKATEGQPGKPSGDEMFRERGL